MGGGPENPDTRLRQAQGNDGACNTLNRRLDDFDNLGDGGELARFDIGGAWAVSRVEDHPQLGRASAQGLGGRCDHAFLRSEQLVIVLCGLGRDQPGDLALDRGQFGVEDLRRSRQKDLA